MQLESVAVALRPRNLWEAIDLGFSMVHAWWKPVFGAWLAVVLPVAVLINLLCWEVQWLAPLLMWWLKPLFDRIPLYVLSRATFGDPPKIRETIRAVLPLWRNSFLWDLTLGRFDLARSFNMPVRDLEGLRGKARRQRLKVLQKKTRNGAVWLTVVCLNLEFVLNIALFALLYFLLPQTMQADFFKLLFATHPAAWQDVLEHVFYLAAMTAMEPFYVAAGFALYLNRRTLLEGWDIEIAFRRMAQRHQPSARSAASAGVLMSILMVCVLGGALIFPAQSMAAVAATSPAPPAQAVAASQTPEQLKQRISAVLKQPEFQTEKVEQHWKYMGKQASKKQPDSDPAWLKFLARIVPGMARIFEGLLWLLLAAVIVWLIVKRKRWLGWFEHKPAMRPAQPVQVLFGLDIQPQSLPGNIAKEAWKLWQEGQQREALSLLYRGALAYWVTREKIALGANATEGDCMRLFRAGATQETGDYFCQLTHVWQNTAYAGRHPHTEEMQQLCRSWDIHFRPTP
ncbi:5'-nucleotidase/2',3'-cyclic phosphodiesterase and related esterases [Sulfuriferula multivorans]|uniref:5'-nucleotidase/2',3'-cyclic phosphodiesterase and related esterases n=1 Tax=Sulfuriferula multivorans TaxID=1559896 RepID=A0A401JEU8_9PROT|nr:hypothetical protein [Sulfuriferula multivorans]GBL46146.1 5'-nucleotidase/2',3'-cyclic phosphodiesterase and related esterases [Sulfuriferula multivorans]